LDTSEDQASDWYAMPALALAGALWGVSFLFGKWALEELGPAHVTLLRFSLASAALLPYALLKGVWPGRGDLPLFLLVGFLTVPATFLVQFWGLSLTGATVAALIVGCGPPIVALFASLFLGERLGKTGWSAVGASTLGVALAVARPGVSNDWLGDALVLLSLLAVVGWVLLGKRLGDGYPAVPATAWILTFGTLTLAPVALLWEGVPRLDLTLLGWASVLVLGLGCSAATYALWNWGVARVPASRAGVFLNLEPLVGALLGVLVLGEAWGPGTVVGGALIIGAALVVSRRSSA
jgi:drug/metabolite transporter (DMT)-like permease